MKKPDVSSRSGRVSRNSGRFGWANCGHSSPSGSTSRPERVDDRLVLVGVQRADGVDDRAACASSARRPRAAARAAAPAAACARQRRSGRRARRRAPSTARRRARGRSRCSSSSRTSALTTCTFAPASRSASARARPACISTAVTSPASSSVLPPGAAQASRMRSPSLRADDQGRELRGAAHRPHPRRVDAIDDVGAGDVGRLTDRLARREPRAPAARSARASARAPRRRRSRAPRPRRSSPGTSA